MATGEESEMAVIQKTAEKVQDAMRAACSSQEGKSAPACKALVVAVKSLHARKRRLAAVAAWAASPSAVCVRTHESSNNYAINTGNGYYGAYQFNLSTWESNGGGPGLPSAYPPVVQDEVAYNTWLKRGWQPWPDGCNGQP